MFLRLTILLISLLLTSCASNKLIQPSDELNIVESPAVKLHLKTADAQFTELKNLQSHVLFPDEFNDIKNKFKTLIQFIERGEVQNAIQQQPELIDQMIKLEIKTLKQSHLGEAINYIKEAKELDASSYAPFSLKKAETLLSSAQALIQKSYRDRNAIAKLSTEAVSSAKKLYFIAKETNALHNESDEKIEQHMIANYDFLKNVESILEINPIEIQDYTAQKNTLIAQIKAFKTLLATPQPIPEAAPEKSIQKDACKDDNQIETPQVIYSQETNKAVLPELLMPKGYSEPTIIDDEDLEFDSIEIVK